MNNSSPVAAVKRRWWLVVAMALVGAVIGGFPQPERVEETATSFGAVHTMLANDGGDTSIVSPSQVTLLATTGEVPARVAERINYPGNSAELARQVEVVFDFETSALRITTEQATPELAVEIADGFAEELNAYLAERQDEVYEDRVAGSRARLEALQTAQDEITAALAANPTDPTLLAERDAIARQYTLAFEQNGILEQNPDRLTFTTLQSAQAVPQVDRGLSAPTGRSTRAVMGLAVGGALGTVLAIILGSLDRKIRSRADAEELMQMRARVAVPKVRHTTGGVVVSSGRQDPLSDSYRTVRNVVGFVQGSRPKDGTPFVTVVVSPGPGDGKTSLTANLAAAFAETGQRTIAINTDFRRPRLSESITGSPPPTIPFTLEELDDVPRRALLLDSASNLKVLDLSTVEGSPGELARATMRQIDRLGDAADQIVIDTSPVGATAEVLELVPYADVIVIIARVGHTAITAAERTIDILRDIAVAPLVFVVGGVKVERNPYHEYSDQRRQRTPVAESRDDADDELADDAEADGQSTEESDS